MAIDNNLFWNSQHNVGNLTWKLYSDGDTVGTTSGGSTGTNPNSSKLLLQGIIADPNIGINISNEFDNNLGDAFGLSSMIQEAKNIANGLKDAVTTGGAVFQTIKGGIDSLKNAAQSNGMDGTAKVLDASSNVASLAGNLGRVGDIMIGTDYVQMYRGSRANYNIPQLTTIIYHGCIPGAPNMTVKQKLTELVDNIMGNYVGGTALGVFISPNSYKPTFDNIGTERKLEGTYSLEYGGKVLKNLLITDFNFQESTFKVKGRPSETLFASISITLKQATVLVKDNIKNYLK